jgi:hypothetical protein
MWSILWNDSSKERFDKIKKDKMGGTCSALEDIVTYMRYP